MMEEGIQRIIKTGKGTKSELELIDKIGEYQKEIKHWKLKYDKERVTRQEALYDRDKLQQELDKVQYKLKKSWLKFLDISNPKKKTKSFEVTNLVTEEVLGQIKWCGGWRQYVFEDGEIMLAEGCLYELFQKIKALREERQKKNG